MRSSSGRSSGVESYSVRFTRSAVRELEELPTKALRTRIVRAIGALAQSPRPTGCEKLAGGSDRYRIRFGSYRVVYAVDDAHHSIQIVKIGHRSSVYR